MKTLGEKIAGRAGEFLEELLDVELLPWQRRALLRLYDTPDGRRAVARS